MATPPHETAGERLAKAQAEAAAAAGVAAEREEQQRTQDSAAKLARLLKLDAASRFEALADGTIDLVPFDRRRLVRSLKGHVPARRVITGGTATRWALFRSRLRYRKRPLILSGLTLGWALVVIVVAWSNTPVGTVVSVYPQNVPVVFKLPNGFVAADQMVPNQPYGLVRQGNGEAVLRQWIPGLGYAEAHVPADWVKWGP
jgi:hypothetical protein